MPRSALQSARNSARISSTSVSCKAATVGAEQSRAADSSASRRGSGKCSTVAHFLDADAVDLFDLADEDRDRGRVAQFDRELVDRDAVSLLEHVDADDVAVDRSDSRRDESERAGTIGEPDPHQDVECGHDPRWYGPKMTRVFRTGEDTAHPYTRPCGTRWECSAARSIRCTSRTSSSRSETRAALDLDRVLLVVAGDPWQKRGKVVASARDRLMLVEAAVDGVERRRGLRDRGRAGSRVGHRRHARSARGPAPRAVPRARRRRGRQHVDLATARRDARPRDDRGRRAPRRRVRGAARRRAGRSSVSRSHASTSRRRTSAIVWPAAGPIDGLVPPAVVHAIDAHGLYTGGR